MEKVQWNSIDKKQNGLKYSKNYESSTLPRRIIKYIIQSVVQWKCTVDIEQIGDKYHKNK